METICPACGNTQGFAFGTCIECGYNHLTNEYSHIKVYVSDLPKGVRGWLIGEHHRRVNKKGNLIESKTRVGQQGPLFEEKI